MDLRLLGLSRLWSMFSIWIGCGTLVGGKEGASLLAGRAGCWFPFGRVPKLWFGTGSWLGGDYWADFFTGFVLIIICSVDLEMTLLGASLSPPELIGACNPP